MAASAKFQERNSTNGQPPKKKFLELGPTNVSPAAERPMSAKEAENIIGSLARVFLEAKSNPFDNGGDTTQDNHQSLPDIEARYHTLIEQVPAVVFMIFLDRGISEAYVSPYIEASLGFSQKEWLDDPIRWYRQIHPDDKERWNVEAAQMVLSGESLRSVYRIIARDGHTVWFHCDVKMVRTDKGRPWFVHGIAFDITDLKEAEAALLKAHDELEFRIEERTVELAKANSELQQEISERKRIQDDLLRTRRELEIRVQERTAELAIANDVLKREMIERKRLEKSILEISEREKARIAQDLHDGLGQHLTGVAFLSKVLEHKLSERQSPDVDDAKKIARLVNEAINQTRELARGLLPVQAESKGLMSALQHLAAEIEELFNVSCHFKCEDDLVIRDLDLATHLYRIAQEAVTNAIKHGQAGHIAIGLSRHRDKILLSIEDDGSGLPDQLESKDGMGIRIMNYRANMIGAALDIQKKPGGGTIVLCSLVT